MAEFVINYISGKRFLDILEKKYNYKMNEADKTKFLLGNLIPDSSKIVCPKDCTKEQQEKLIAASEIEKIQTHFRSNNDLDLCIQVPIIEKFIDKYDDLILRDMSVLGYLFHLYTDKIFFEDLFSRTFICLDKNNKETKLWRENQNMLITKNSSLINAKLFWAKWYNRSIYSDYAVMNRLLLEHYAFKFDKQALINNLGVFINPGIEEVDFNNISNVLDENERFIKDSYAEKNKNKQLIIFDEQTVIEFIEYVGESFINNYGKYISNFEKKTNQKLKR